MPTDLPLSYDQAAAIVGISNRRLRQIVRDDQGPPQTPNGRFAPDAFGLWFRARIRSDIGVADDGTVYDYEVERGRLTKAQADKTELEVSELRGELLRVEDAIASWTDHVTAARAKLVGLPAKLAPRLADPSRLAEVEKLIREAVYDALDELAGDGLPERARARAAGPRAAVGTAATPDGERVGRPGAKAQSGVKRRARKVAN